MEIWKDLKDSLKNVFFQLIWKISIQMGLSWKIEKANWKV